MKSPTRSPNRAKALRRFISCWKSHSPRAGLLHNELYARLHPCFEQLEGRILLTVDSPISWFQSFDDVPRIQIDSLEIAQEPRNHDSAFIGPRQSATGEWIVQLTNEAIQSIERLHEVAALLSTNESQFSVIAGLGAEGAVLVRGMGASIDVIRSNLDANSLVDGFSINRRIEGQATVPNESDFQAGLLTGLNVIGARDAWDKVRGSSEVVVGVLDTGIDASHPDLYLNMWINQGELPREFLDDEGPALVDIDGDGLITFYDLNNVTVSPSAPYALNFGGFENGPNASFVVDKNQNGRIDAIDLLRDANWADGRDTDGNGFFDDIFGVNFRAGADDPLAPNEPTDPLGHGTHVSGTIGAIGNNGGGVVGVNWRTSLMSLRILDNNNRGDTGAALRAVNYATMMRESLRKDSTGRVTSGANVRVLNNSWGQPGGYEQALEAAIRQAGDAEIMFVAAAGNGNFLGQGVDNDRTPFYPASYDVSNVISVAASTADDQLAFFSNFGAESVDLAAPGVGIRSTLPGGRYGLANGTSMATPHVAGSVALLFADFPDASIAEVRNSLFAETDFAAGLSESLNSSGRLNVFKVINSGNFAPRASLVSASDIVVASSASNVFTVEFSDRQQIDISSLDDFDILVRQDWGPREEMAARLIPSSISILDNGSTVIASYEVSAPGGTWDPLDFGDYQIQINPAEVKNGNGIPAKSTVIGSFRVQVADPSIIYVDNVPDAADADLSDGFSSDIDGNTTLRSAVQEANLATSKSAEFRSTDVPKPITDNTTISSAISVADVSSSVTDVDVRLDITHTFNGDLSVFLVSPTGRRVELFSSIGGGSENFEQTIFDDEATLDIELATAPFAGRFRPVGSLADFNGDDPNGIWLLEISDNAFLDTGSLNSWSLDFTQLAESSRTLILDAGHYELGLVGNSEENSAEGDLDILGNISIIGDSAGQTLIDGMGVDRVFDVHLGGRLKLERISVTGGRADNGGGVLSNGALFIVNSEVVNNFAFDLGGGIGVESGVTEIIGSSIRNNEMPLFGHLLSGGFGGGLAVGDALASVTQSTIAHNTSRFGGGIFSYSDIQDHSRNLVLTNSTISNNHAFDDGGGLLIGKDASIDHVTVASNDAESNDTDGYAAYGTSTQPVGFVVHVANSIFAGNGNRDVSDFDFLGDWRTTISRRYAPLESDTGIESRGSNLVGRLASATAINVFNKIGDKIDPAAISQLGPLRNNGGPTETHALLPGSPALDSALNSTQSVDQRGIPRLQDAIGDGIAVSDIGAFEGRFATVTGEVFRDVDSDGSRDGNEVGLVGRKVFVDLNVNGAHDQNEPFSFTKPDDPATTGVNESGTYVLSGLEPGVYQIVHREFDGWEVTYPIAEGINIAADGSLAGGIWSIDTLSLSADGRYVAFATSASLEEDDKNNVFDVYVFDRQRSEMERVSLASDGTEGNSDSMEPAISADGRYVAFRSLASNLVTGDGNGEISDIFVHDRLLRTTELITRAKDGLSTNDYANRPAISSNGRFVVYDSSASNIVEDDNNGLEDVFVYDRLLGATDRVNVATDGSEANRESSNFTTTSISGDGRFVVFDSRASNLTQPANTLEVNDIFLHDRELKTTKQITVGANGGEADGNSIKATISENGQFIVFASFASNLIEGDTESGIFLYEVPTGELTKVGSGQESSISSDGRYVSFFDFDFDLVKQSLVIWDRLTGTYATAVLGFFNNLMKISPDGKVVAFFTEESLIDADANDERDVYVAENPFTSESGAEVRLFSSQIKRIDFGTNPLDGEIRGRTFEDLVENSAFDIGEPGLGDWTVFADLNGNRRLDNDEPISRTQADGSFVFAELATETSYTIVVDVPPGWEQILPTGDVGFVWEVFLPAAGTIANRDFGFRRVTTTGQSNSSGVAGRVYDEIGGGNGYQAGIDRPLAGIEVFLDANNDGRHNSGVDEPIKLTDSEGRYSFSQLGSRIVAVSAVLDDTTLHESPLGNKFSVKTTPLFSGVQPFGNPQAIEAADFNNDGFLDIAVVLGEGSILSIRLNNGHGGFVSDGLNIDLGQAGSGPTSLVIGQFGNAGTLLDIAVTSQLASNVVLVNNIDVVNRTFESLEAYRVGFLPSDLATGYFNNDNHLDLAVLNRGIANRGGPSISVLLNDGNGFFGSDSVPIAVVAQQPVFPTRTMHPIPGNGSSAIVVGEFTGDTFVDVAVANSISSSATSPNGDVRIFAGDGTGGLNYDGNRYEVGAGPTDLRTTDLNGDGLLDLAVANFLSNSISVLTATTVSGHRSLRVEPTVLGTASGALDISFGDIDNDGDQDVISTNLNDRNISIFRNVGLDPTTGTVLFEPGENVGLAQFAFAQRMPFVVADFDTARSGPNNSLTLDIVAIPQQTDTLYVLNNTLAKGAHRVNLTGTNSFNGLDFVTTPALIAPSLNEIISPLPILEDSPAQTLALSGIALGRSGGPSLRLTASSSDTSIIPTPTVSYFPGETTGSVDFTPVSDMSGQVMVTITARDAGVDQLFDTADDGVVSRTFSVTILPVNDPPTFNLPSARTVTVNEDASAQTMAIFVAGIGPGGGVSELAQTLSAFTVTADRPELFSSPPAIDEQGTLRFTPAANAAGTTTVTVTLSDNGGVANGGSNVRSDVFVINIQPVNDAPSIALAGNQSLAINAATQIVNSFATNFQPGGGTDEASQQVAGFLVTTDRPELFTVHPTIDAVGTLRYTPAKNRAGTAQVTVRVRDDGGMALGGSDLSSPQSFDIQITGTPDNTPPAVSITTQEPNPTFRRTFSVAINFSEPVVGFELADLLVINGSSSEFSKTSPDSYSAVLTANGDGVVAMFMSAGAVQDLAGNANLLPASFLISVDSGASSFKPLLMTNEPTTTGNRNFAATVDFGREVTGFDGSDLSVINATVNATSDLGSGRYLLELQAESEGDVLVNLAAGKVQDSAGRMNSAADPLTVNYVDVSNSDFGDAPTAAQSGFVASYPTNLVDDAARHRITGLFLGSIVDAENNGQPSVNALGDDQAGTVGDEDGVSFIVSAIVSDDTATTSSVVVTASQPGKLDGWIDFNHDGDWLDSGEQIFTSLTVAAGSNRLSYTIPAGATSGSSYARFRLSSAGGLLPAGPAADGEVEDYPVELISSGSSTVLSIRAEDVGDHVVSVSNGQLVVSQGASTIFRAPLASVGSVQLLDASAMVLAELKRPQSNLIGSLRLIGDRITLASISPLISLSSLVPSEIVGVHTVDLTSVVTQNIQFQLSSVQAINADKSLRIELGDDDLLQAGPGWTFDTVTVEENRFVSHFSQSDASLKVRSSQPWQNPLNPFDVTGDGIVSALDVLQVINDLNGQVLTSNGVFKSPGQVSSNDFRFLDTDGNNFLSPQDVLLVINKLNEPSSGEGEFDLQPRPKSNAFNLHSSRIHDYALAQLVFEELDLRRRHRQSDLWRPSLQDHEQMQSRESDGRRY